MSLDALDGTGYFAGGIPLFGISAALLPYGQPSPGLVLAPGPGRIVYRLALKLAFGWAGSRSGWAVRGVPAHIVGVLGFRRLPQEVGGGPPYPTSLRQPPEFASGIPGGRGAGVGGL